MKTLTPEQIANFVKLLELTHERELTCGEFLRDAGAFARATHEGQPLDDALELVRQHTIVCPECREEYEALFKIIAAGK